MKPDLIHISGSSVICSLAHPDGPFMTVFPLPSPPPLKPVLSSGRCPLCSQCSGRFQLRLLH